MDVFDCGPLSARITITDSQRLLLLTAARQANTHRLHTLTNAQCPRCYPDITTSLSRVSV